LTTRTQNPLFARGRYCHETNSENTSRVPSKPVFRLGRAERAPHNIPMPTYSSLDSPSFRKMEGSRRDYSRRRFSLAHIIGDPFALATTTIAIVSRPLHATSCSLRMRGTST